MINDTTNTATGEPVTEQAPAVDTTSTTQATPTAPGLPDGYLSGGYYATTDKGDRYLRPELVGSQARQLAAALDPLRPSDFNALLREMKKAKKKKSLERAFSVKIEDELYAKMEEEILNAKE